jgi:acyl-CoA synthetase (NDP forming)
VTLASTQDRARLSGVERLRGLFAPASLAVVGASETSSWARNLLHSLSLVPGTRKIVPVNPKHSTQFGRPSVASLRDLPEPVDLAFVLVAADKVESVLRDAAAAGIRHAIVLAGGFGEAGADGTDRQADLVRIAAELDITVLGPNTIGFLNPHGGFAPWAVATAAPPLVGSLGAVFESGSMARATYQFAQAHGVGSSLWVSVGNGAVVDSIDVIDYLVQHEGTRAVAVFLETIKDAARFQRATRAALEAGIPVVAFKAGRSEQGRRSAAAHTGALATDDAVVDAAFTQCGVTRVSSLEELVATAGMFATTRRIPSGSRMGVVTSSGGGCNVIADLAEDEGITLPAWSSGVVEALRESMPAESWLQNPLDTTGFGHARKRHRPTKAEDDLLEITCAEPGVDFLYSMMTPLPAAPPEDEEARTALEERLRILGDIVRNSPLPVFLSSNTCLDLADYPRGLLSDQDLHLLPGADLAMKALGHLGRWSSRRERALRSIGSTPWARPRPTDTAVRTWAEDEGRELLAAHAVALVPAVLARSGDEAAKAQLDFGTAVAMKICSRAVAHKSDVGGVRLDVAGEQAVRAAHTEIRAAVAAAAPDADQRGVLVSPMRPPGVDLMVGVSVDSTLGPVLTLALGGIWVEIMHDSALRVLPVTEIDVREMIDGLRAAPLLHGCRGTAAVDLDAVCAAVVGVTDAALALGGRLEALEVNPLRVRGSQVEALDVLVVTGE